MNPSAALFAALIKSMLGISVAVAAGGSMGDVFGGSPTAADGQPGRGIVDRGAADYGAPPPEAGRLVPKIQLPQDQSGRRDSRAGLRRHQQLQPQQEYKDVSY
jgi:hypothetical protein